MFELHHRFLDDFTHVLLNPLQLGQDTVAAWPVVHLSPRELRVQAHLMPALLPLADLPRPRRMELLDEAIRWQQDYGRDYFSGCLVCKAETQRLAYHFGRMMIASGPGAQRFLLRYSDPRVFTQLLGILDDSQLDALMGPVEQWRWVDIFGVVRRRDGRDDRKDRLWLRADQFPSLQRVGHVNACLSALARSNMNCGDAVILGRQLDAALCDAVLRFGLRDDEDRRLYAIQSVASGMPADKDPRLKAALARATAGEISYVGACAEFTDSPFGLPSMESGKDRSREQT